MKSVADLERGLPLGAANRQAAASNTATALEATASNVYDFLMRVAASVSKVQEHLAEAKESFLSDRAVVSAPLRPDLKFNCDTYMRSTPGPHSMTLPVQAFFLYTYYWEWDGSQLYSARASIRPAVVARVQGQETLPLRVRGSLP